MTTDPHTEPRPGQCPMCGGAVTVIRNDDGVWDYVAIEAEASTGADAPRHYPNDNCGDANHDAILEAWYELANRILDGTGAAAAARSSEGVDANFIGWAGQGPGLAPSSEAVEARLLRELRDAVVRYNVAVSRAPANYSKEESIAAFEAMNATIKSADEFLATASSREGDAE